MLPKRKTYEQMDEELRTMSDALVVHYAKDFQPAKVGGRKFEQLEEDLQFAMRAANEQVRREDERQRKAAERAEAQRLTAQHDAQVSAAVETFKAQARAAFPGTAAEFEAQWPQIKAAWQQQQTLDQIARAAEQKRGDYSKAF